MHRRGTTTALVAALTCLAGALGGCGDDTPKTGAPTSTPPTSSSATRTPTPSPTPTPSSPATPSPTGQLSDRPDKGPAAEPSRLGIDASHHQGPIDWARVAGHGITFAYLKATEGTGFTDPRFAAHRTEARRHGISVAGYHYFQLCSDGTAQAEHFLDVLGPGKVGRGGLAPAIDLELAGSCGHPPAADVLLGEVREFLTLVDERLGTRTVVYLYPEFEDRFGFADDLADHPQWVRRLGDRPPQRPWQIWQYDDSGSVPGIAGGVDLNRTQGTTDAEER